jgi:hypothetical protein
MNAFWYEMHFNEACARINFADLLNQAPYASEFATLVTNLIENKQSTQAIETAMLQFMDKVLEESSALETNIIFRLFPSLKKVFSSKTNTPFFTTHKEAVQEKFKKTYEAIHESDHFDEFLIPLHTMSKGDIYTHSGFISVTLTDYLKQSTIQPVTLSFWEKILQFFFKKKISSPEPSQLTEKCIEATNPIGQRKSVLSLDSLWSLEPITIAKILLKDNLFEKLDKAIVTKLTQQKNIDAILKEVCKTASKSVYSKFVAIFKDTESSVSSQPSTINSFYSPKDKQPSFFQPKKLSSEIILTINNPSV